jgi:hypothetical protein
MGATQTRAATSVEIKLQLDHPSAEIIWARALEVFGNEEKARQWMDTPRAISKAPRHNSSLILEI